MANMQIVCLAIFAIYCGITVATPLLGEKECTWGPTYWCSNITNAKGCKAVSHCIKAVWEKQKFPVDDDDVCTICTNMVKQARDQLESNQTQEDLKAVFEGSCKLIPIDIVSNECVKLVDEFIPELVETLASQMNPQAVCTVAGLCNNARIDKMLEEAKKNKVSEESPKETNLCAGCHTVIGNMRSNFDDLSYTGFLQSALKICFKLGSFSDSCATALVTNFENIYSHLKENFYADNVCHDFGTCTEKFHQHESKEKKTSNVQITPMGGVGMIASKEGDDVPCELCEQLVKHLRDILVANTTESEFKRVLDGLCKQSGTFKSECLSIVDQYYPLIYSFLTNELDANSVCGMVGICPKTLADEDAPIAPILLMPPTKIQGTLDRVLIEEDESKNFKHSVSIGDNQMKVKVVTPELGQLPIERMMVAIPQNQELCTFCQYFLHFIQVHISDAKTEQEIKDLVESGCKILPNAIDSQCEAFVDAYGNAIIALLVQEIDPSQVCPLLTLCPKEEQVTNVEILMTSGNGDKPSCPLCLFAVEQLQTMLKDNKTEESIQNALDNLCSHLPTKLKAECSDFVDTYSKQLFEMLVAEFTPQEVCVYLKLCTDNKPDVSSLKTLSAVDQYHSKRKPMADHNNFKKPLLPKEMLVDTSKHVQIETNEIPDNTFNGKPLIYADTTPKVAPVEASPGCIICEFILSEIDKELQDKHNADEVKKVVHSICNHLPSTVGKECNDFVDKYADLVITLLSQGLAPAEFCGAIALCTDQNIKLQNNIMECAVCEEAIDVVEQLLTNPEVDRKLEHIIEKTCYALPARYLDRCTKLMSTYGESIIHLVSHLADSGKVCSEIGMCAAESFSHLQMEKVAPKKKLVGGDRCTWGPSYWCKSEDRANECGAINHCRERVWLAEKPPGRVARSTELLGKKKCSYGPSYWCENEDQANECKAINHCRERVWLAEKPPGRVARSTELLGKKKCSYGPSYWCENEDQANECKALEHCRQRVWKAQKPAGN